MTTPTRAASSNKSALRASLKKEDESLAERLAATDVPLVAEPEAETPVVAVPASEPAPTAGKAAKVAVKTVAAQASGETKSAVAKAPAKTGKKPARAKSPAAKTAVPEAAPAAAPKARPVARKAAAEAKSAALEKPAKRETTRKKRGPVTTAAPTTKESAGKPLATLEEAVVKVERVTKDKGDKLVRYTVELLKSEAAAIESLRVELAKAAGWAASKSDILRAGVKVFAEQKLDEMKSVLGALAGASKAGKKG
ncbi:hypothetical protein [Accumulibacter sp.]|uniref:hypothetical protein n=1 Tax=Accumulibacter sp. TaxID=2053492 RepID=UPI002628D530|nr:hypothetical protein [Accumulibacter sp.]